MASLSGTNIMLSLWQAFGNLIHSQRHFCMLAFQVANSGQDVSWDQGSGLAYWSPGYPIEKYVPPRDGSQVRSFKSNSPILLLNE